MENYLVQENIKKIITQNKTIWAVKGLISVEIYSVLLKPYIKTHKKMSADEI